MHTFYSLERVADEVSSGEPVDLPLAEIEQLLRKLGEEGDFLGVIDPRGTTLQVAFQDEDTYWLEIPRPEEEGSYGRVVDFAELAAIFAQLPETFDVDAFPGFAFQSW